MNQTYITICVYGVICFSILSALPDADARSPGEAQMVGEKQMEGLFYGTALESGNINKIETRITGNASTGKLQGDYTLHQPRGKKSIPGRLTEQQPLKDHHVIFKWVDSAGKGTVDMIFDNTGSAFKGRWSADDGSAKNLPWTGQRRHASANWDGVKLPESATKDGGLKVGRQ